MRSERELREFLRKCKDAPREGNGMLTDICPIDGESGCCAECSFPSGIVWALEETSQTMLASEEVLGKDWNSPDEDKAWSYLSDRKE